MKARTVAVIGGGPMGLATAYYLCQKGYAVKLFEKDVCLGGMSTSFDFDGVSIEKYYHFVNRPDEDLFALLRELGMEQELRWRETKMGFFRRSAGDGTSRVHPWGNPLALLALHDIPLLTRLRYGLHAFSCKFIQDLLPLDAVSAKDWIQRWEGEAGYNLLWRPLFAKKFFELSEPLSAAWIASRIRRVANSRKSLMCEELGYLEGGSQSLIAALEREIRAKDGEIFCHCPVQHIRKEDTGFCVETVSGCHSHIASVVCTVPLPYIQSLVPSLPQEYMQKVQQIRNIGVACALFRLEKPLTNNFWLNIDMPDWDIPGIIEYSNLRPMQAAHLYIPFYMPHTHANWQANDDKLLDKARMYMRMINADAAQTEQAARLFRYTYAQPVCPPHFRQALPAYQTGIDGLYIADTTHSFPEDRSIQESVRIAQSLAQCCCEYMQ